MASGKRARRDRTPEQKAAAAAAAAERLDALHRQLNEGVAAIRDGQAWQDWLNVASRFTRYSFGNQILIAAQMPGATRVAGYGAWTALGRQVRKGEKGIRILAPITVRGPATADQAGADDQPDTATPDPAPGGPGERRPAGSVRFRGTAVFDVSQTDGDPLPTPPRPQLLEGHAPEGLWDALAEAITTRGYTVTRCPDAAAIGGANGITDYLTNTVTVRADIDDAHAAKTLAHEAGHVLLHNPTDRAAGPDCRGLIEVEAESVAYLVAGHHGMPTGDYTFAYIAGWAGRDADAVTSTARRVLAAARDLIAATDPDTMTDPAAAAAAAVASSAGVTATAGTAADAAATRARLVGALDPAANQLRAVLTDAQEWFGAQAAASAVFATAVTARGYTPAQAGGYGLGFAPASWTGLVDHLRTLGHPDADLLAAGVASTARGGRLIDRFRGRITFPIHDPDGIVGWTGRDTTGEERAPKYVNSPASGLYDKGRVLFGTQHLPAAGDAGLATTVVLVEGPWDALALTHAGGGHTIGLAACGTAVTDAHLDLVRGRTLVLAPDSDPAGTVALGRTLDMLAQRGQAHPDAVHAPTGKDLAEVMATGGPDAVRAALAGARPAGIVYAQAHLDGLSPGEYPEARVGAARAAAAHTAGLTLGQRADLGALLQARAGIGPEAALALIAPPAAVAPKPAAASARPHAGRTAARL